MNNARNEKELKVLFMKLVNTGDLAEIERKFGRNGRKQAEKVLKKRTQWLRVGDLVEYIDKVLPIKTNAMKAVINKILLDGHKGTFSSGQKTRSVQLFLSNYQTLDPSDMVRKLVDSHTKLDVSKFTAFKKLMEYDVDLKDVICPIRNRASKEAAIDSSRGTENATKQSRAMQHRRQDNAPLKKARASSYKSSQQVAQRVVKNNRNAQRVTMMGKQDHSRKSSATAATTAIEPPKRLAERGELHETDSATSELSCLEPFRKIGLRTHTPTASETQHVFVPSKKHTARRDKPVVPRMQTKVKQARGTRSKVSPQNKQSQFSRQIAETDQESAAALPVHEPRKTLCPQPSTTPKRGPSSRATTLENKPVLRNLRAMTPNTMPEKIQQPFTKLPAEHVQHNLIAATKKKAGTAERPSSRSHETMSSIQSMAQKKQSTSLLAKRPRHTGDNDKVQLSQGGKTKQGSDKNAQLTVFEHAIVSQNPQTKPPIYQSSPSEQHIRCGVQGSKPNGTRTRLETQKQQKQSPVTTCHTEKELQFMRYRHPELVALGFLRLNIREIGDFFLD